jgi:multisubunit Na+/H+ antiporter MnhB subunit
MNKSPREKSRTGPGRGAGRPILLTLLSGAVVLSFLFCALVLVLYILALREEGEDSGPYALIQWAVYGGVALGILSLYRFFAGLWFGFRRRRPLSFLSSLGFLILGILGVLMAAALSFVRSLAGGTM